MAREIWEIRRRIQDNLARNKREKLEIKDIRKGKTLLLGITCRIKEWTNKDIE